MFERFADEARRATALASEEARELGHDFIGTEHLLLGLLASGEGTGFSVLTELEVTLEDARRKVSERVHAYGSGSVDSPPFTPLAKKSLERALREALGMKAKLIGSEHLLLGLVAVPDGGGARILAELAGSPEHVREAVLTRVGHPPQAAAFLEQTKAPVTSRTLRRWATQGLLVLRPPTNVTETEVEATGAEAEAAPHCPNCQASVEVFARYRQVAVLPEPEPESQSGSDIDAGAEAPDVPEVAADAGGDAIATTFVFCGKCGAVLGVV
jgi:hypothetical protein